MVKKVLNWASIRRHHHPPRRRRAWFGRYLEMVLASGDHNLNFATS